nr:p20E [Baboon endogenous virus strain M7]
ATLLPDIDIIPGDEPVPIPAIDHFIYRPKRAIQFIPLLAGLGITAAFTTGATGLGVSVTQYTKLSNQLISDVQILSSTIQDLQDQVDSLAEVVLQNRRGLDLLTAEQGGICLALQEKCCFYVNKSGIVRDKIKTLQEELERRRKDLASNPLWTGLQGLLPYLLPFLGPLLTLLLLLTIGPCIFNRLTAFINDKLNIIHAMVLTQQYQVLRTDEEAQD